MSTLGEILGISQQVAGGAVVSVSTRVVLTRSDIPEPMPLTNRLNKMNVEQAAWAIRNGTAWLAYLKANGGEVYEHTGASAVEVSPAEVYKAICDTLENVWLALTSNMEQSDMSGSTV